MVYYNILMSVSKIMWTLKIILSVAVVAFIHYRAD